MSILGVQPICCCRHSSTFFVMLLGGIIGFYFNGLVWLGVCDFVGLFLLSLLLRVLVGEVFEVAVITIMPYCPLMS
jgi:hypothetical protein